MNDIQHNYHFKARSGQGAVVCEFVLNDNGEPVKLGDGTFGCVFHVREKASRNFAIKIFYENKDYFIQKSQEQEMEIGDRLRKFYKDESDSVPTVDRYLVVPQATVKNFKQSTAYKNLEPYFEKLSFKISRNAILMNLYPMSLKDLLEKGWPESRGSSRGPKTSDNADEPIGRGAGGTFGERSGYSILRSLSQAEREKCILPFIVDIAEALSLLHAPGFRHQDIKPANVLVRQVGPNIEAAIADLGFIDTGIWQAHGSLQQNQPLGTRHYRSPEQTDYFDICEVNVAKHESGGYELETKDPKFTNTFSEEGDLVVFAKLQERLQWEITDITTPDGGQDGGQEKETVRIIIRGLEGTQLEPDERTQISVHKKQTARTDLFGLGAIIYDMLTCGRSPEQFYDLLRAHDLAGGGTGAGNSGIERGLLQQYLHFKNGGGMIPEIDAIFQSLRVDSNSDFPSVDIVKIVLKCMMSKPPDSYFNADTTTEKKNVWSSVKKDLRDFLSGVSATDYQFITRNHITSGDTSEAYQDKTPSKPSDNLQEIQSLSYKDPKSCAERLVKGARFFHLVAKMIQKELSQPQHYLMNVSPKTLKDHRGEFSPQFAFYEKEKDFTEALTFGNPRTVVKTLSAGTLLPPFMYALVRECEIWTDEEAQPEQAPQIRYDLWGADFGKRGVNKGDRLILELSPTVRINALIDVADTKSFELVSEEAGDVVTVLAALKNGRKIRAVTFKKFTPSDYYISMLGIYVRLIFFVDPADKQEFIPQAVYSYEQGRIAGFFGDIDLRENRFSKTPDTLFHNLANLYLCLLTRQVSSITGSKDGASMDLTVLRIANKLRDWVARTLRCDADTLVSNTDVDQFVKNIKRPPSAKQFPNIEMLTTEIVRAAMNRGLA